MQGLTREELLEMLPAYALGALDAEERAAVDAGLQRFPDLRATLADFQAVSAGLGASVPAIAPPPALKAALMARIAQTQAQPSLWQRFIHSFNRLALVPRLALIALVLVTGVALMLVARNAATLAVEQQQIQAILSGSTDQVVLQGTNNAPDAIAILHYAGGQQQGAMQVRNLPALSRDQAYQLWLVNDKGVRWSGAVFNVPASGETSVLVDCPEPIQDMVRFGVSIEPAGGSPGPTGPAVLRTARS